MINEYIKRKLEFYLIKKQGGEKTSLLIRKKYQKEYNVTVGLHSYGGCFNPYFNNGGKVIIGRYCSFAPNIRFFGANHPMDYVSMSPYFYQQEWANSVSKVIVNDVKRSTLHIGNDCWIGYNAIITNKCRHIGNGAVIGAGSVVTQDVEPYTVVAGNPAKLIRKRFDDETIEMLELSKWWELEPAQLLNFYNDISNPILFAKECMDYHNTKI